MGPRQQAYLVLQIAPLVLGSCTIIINIENNDVGIEDEEELTIGIRSPGK